MNLQEFERYFSQVNPNLKTLSYFACKLRSQSLQLVLELSVLLGPSVGKDHEVCLHLGIEQAHRGLTTKTRSENTINNRHKDTMTVEFVCMATQDLTAV